EREREAWAPLYSTDDSYATMLSAVMTSPEGVQYQYTQDQTQCGTLVTPPAPPDTIALQSTVRLLAIVNQLQDMIETHMADPSLSYALTPHALPLVKSALESYDWAHAVMEEAIAKVDGVLSLQFYQFLDNYDTTSSHTDGSTKFRYYVDAVSTDVSTARGQASIMLTMLSAMDEEISEQVSTDGTVDIDDLTLFYNEAQATSACEADSLTFPLLDEDGCNAEDLMSYTETLLKEIVAELSEWEMTSGETDMEGVWEMFSSMAALLDGVQMYTIESSILQHSARRLVGIMSYIMTASLELEPLDVCTDHQDGASVPFYQFDRGACSYDIMYQFLDDCVVADEDLAQYDILKSDMTCLTDGLNIMLMDNPSALQEEGGAEIPRYPYLMSPNQCSVRRQARLLQSSLNVLSDESALTEIVDGDGGFLYTRIAHDTDHISFLSSEALAENTGGDGLSGLYGIDDTVRREEYCADTLGKHPLYSNYCISLPSPSWDDYVAPTSIERERDEEPGTGTVKTTRTEPLVTSDALLEGYNKARTAAAKSAQALERQAHSNVASPYDRVSNGRVLTRSRTVEPITDGNTDKDVVIVQCEEAGVYLLDGECVTCPVGSYCPADWDAAIECYNAPTGATYYASGQETCFCPFRCPSLIFGAGSYANLYGGSCENAYDGLYSVDGTASMGYCRQSAAGLTSADVSFTGPGTARGDADSCPFTVKGALSIASMQQNDADTETVAAFDEAVRTGDGVGISFSLQMSEERLQSDVIGGLVEIPGVVWLALDCNSHDPTMTTKDIELEVIYPELVLEEGEEPVEEETVYETHTIDWVQSRTCVVRAFYPPTSDNQFYDGPVSSPFPLDSRWHHYTLNLDFDQHLLSLRLDHTPVMMGWMNRSVFTSSHDASFYSTYVGYEDTMSVQGYPFLPIFGGSSSLIANRHYSSDPNLTDTSMVGFIGGVISDIELRASVMPYSTSPANMPPLFLRDDITDNTYVSTYSASMSNHPYTGMYIAEEIDTAAFIDSLSVQPMNVPNMLLSDRDVGAVAWLGTKYTCEDGLYMSQDGVTCTMINTDSQVTASTFTGDDSLSVSAVPVYAKGVSVECAGGAAVFNLGIEDVADTVNDIVTYSYVVIEANIGCLSTTVTDLVFVDSEYDVYYVESLESVYTGTTTPYDAETGTGTDIIVIRVDDLDLYDASERYMLGLVSLSLSMSDNQCGAHEIVYDKFDTEDETLQTVFDDTVLAPVTGYTRTLAKVSLTHDKSVRTDISNLTEYNRVTIAEGLLVPDKSILEDGLTDREIANVRDTEKVILRDTSVVSEVGTALYETMELLAAGEPDADVFHPIKCIPCETCTSTETVESLMACECTDAEATSDSSLSLYRYRDQTTGTCERMGLLSSPFISVSADSLQTTAVSAGITTSLGTNYSYIQGTEVVVIPHSGTALVTLEATVTLDIEWDGDDVYDSGSESYTTTTVDVSGYECAIFTLPTYIVGTVTCSSYYSIETSSSVSPTSEEVFTIKRSALTPVAGTPFGDDYASYWESDAEDAMSWPESVLLGRNVACEADLWGIYVPRQMIIGVDPEATTYYTIIHASNQPLSAACADVVGDTAFCRETSGDVVFSVYDPYDPPMVAPPATVFAFSEKDDTCLSEMMIATLEVDQELYAAACEPAVETLSSALPTTSHEWVMLVAVGVACIMTLAMIVNCIRWCVRPSPKKAWRMALTQFPKVATAVNIDHALQKVKHRRVRENLSYLLRYDNRYSRGRKVNGKPYGLAIYPFSRKGKDTATEILQVHEEEAWYNATVGVRNVLGKAFNDDSLLSLLKPQTLAQGKGRKRGGSVGSRSESQVGSRVQARKRRQEEILGMAGIYSQQNEQRGCFGRRKEATRHRGQGYAVPRNDATLNKVKAFRVVLKKNEQNPDKTRSHIPAAIAGQGTLMTPGRVFLVMWLRPQIARCLAARNAAERDMFLDAGAFLVPTPQCQDPKCRRPACFYCDKCRRAGKGCPFLYCREHMLSVHTGITSYNRPLIDKMRKKGMDADNYGAAVTYAKRDHLVSRILECSVCHKISIMYPMDVVNMARPQAEADECECDAEGHRHVSKADGHVHSHNRLETMRLMCSCCREDMGIQRDVVSTIEPCDLCGVLASTIRCLSCPGGRKLCSACDYVVHVEGCRPYHRRLPVTDTLRTDVNSEHLLMSVEDRAAQMLKPERETGRERERELKKGVRVEGRDAVLAAGGIV
ncbi:hypothetical protein KIPB_001673, partial [Kipferlia bialata]